MTAGVGGESGGERHSERLFLRRIVDAVTPTEFEKCSVGEVRRLRQQAGGGEGRGGRDDRRMPAVAGHLNESGARSVIA